MEGLYKVAVFFAGREIPKSPYVVNVEAMAVDPSKVLVDGAGVGSAGRVQVDETTSFRVHTTSQFCASLLPLSLCV